MYIFKIIAGLINLVLMFLFFIMPVWLPILILKIRYKKMSGQTVIPTDPNVEEKTNLFKFIYSINKFVWLNSAIALILLCIGYKLVLNGGCEGMACLGMSFLLAPFILSFIIIGIILIVTLISSITKFYYPNQMKFTTPKYIKIILYFLLGIIIIYSFFGHL